MKMQKLGKLKNRNLDKCWLKYHLKYLVNTVNKWKGILKIMYTKNIKNPYSMALEIPLSFSFFLVKKLTVKESSEIHKVLKELRIPKIPNKKILNNELSLFSITFSFSVSHSDDCSFICSGKNP